MFVSLQMVGAIAGGSRAFGAVAEIFPKDEQEKPLPKVFRRITTLPLLQEVLSYY